MFEILNQLSDKDFQSVLNAEIEKIKDGEIKLPAEIENGIYTAISKMDQIGLVNESLNNLIIERPLLTVMTVVILVCGLFGTAALYDHKNAVTLNNMISEYNELKTSGTVKQVRDKKYQIINFIKSNIASKYNKNAKYQIKNNVLYHIDHSQDKHNLTYDYDCEFKPGMTIDGDITFSPGFKFYSKKDHSKDIRTEITPDNFDQFIN